MKRQRGFSLIEVMIAMAVFGLVVAAMAPAFAAHMRFITKSDIRTGAIGAAQRVLDDHRFQDPSDMPASGSVGPTAIIIGARTYQVTTTYCSPTTHCTSPDIKQINVEVSYLNEVVYEIETVFTDLR